MVEVPGWDDEIRPALQALVDHVGEQFKYMTTATDYPQVRQLAAAYLARVRRLIMCFTTPACPMCSESRFACASKHG